ncbi:hypothetical protein INR49_003403 [Caranx melampygus]|nr:hypothetical protein INR49_003403 [Caranx melampygus]
MWDTTERPASAPDTMTADLNLTSLLNVTDLHNHSRGCSLTKTGFQFYYLPTVYIMVFITGLVGNSLAIWMFVCHMRPWSSISSLGRLKKKSAVITSVLVWVVVVISISPILYYSRTGLKRNATICYDTTTEDELPGYFIYSMTLTVFGFCIPLLLYFVATA